MKKQIYPKTKRLSLKAKTEITEKIDGSNIGIFKLPTGKLLIATRNFVYLEDEVSKISLKGFNGWFEENKEELKEKIHEGSGFFGEWLGSGLIKYNFRTRLLIFAKARINEDYSKSEADYNITNLYYNHDLIQYCFKDGELPKNIEKVPVVVTLDTIPTVEELDKIYKEYSEKENRIVEGFIINNNNNVLKYVRYKNGKPSEHKE